MGKKKGGGFFGGIAKAVTGALGGIGGALGGIGMAPAQPKEPKINFPAATSVRALTAEDKELSKAELGQVSAGAQKKTKGLIAPGYLELGAGLSPLQQRTAIATKGVSGTLGQDPAAFKYYHGVAFSSLGTPAGETTGEPTPIERQYLQVFGEPTKDTSTGS
ncbi:MAG TPA: hypothetical protein VLS45_08310, partial [Methylomicrobium sp.]|nr:hypothetical protein [Methylomicrobium sp.]